MRDVEDCGKYSVEWSDEDGNEIFWESFMTMREARKFAKDHRNDKDKHDMHVKKWKILISGIQQFPIKEWECVDTFELEDIL